MAYEYELRLFQYELYSVLREVRSSELLLLTYLLTISVADSVDVRKTAIETETTSQSITTHGVARLLRNVSILTAYNTYTPCLKKFGRLSAGCHGVFVSRHLIPESAGSCR